MPAPERRRQLLDVGRALFAEKGFAATSIEEIAASAGVSKPVVYGHFGGKDGLHAAVVDRELHRLRERFGAALSAPDHPRQLLERAALVLLEYIEQDTDGFRVLVRDAPAGSGAGSSGSLIGEVAREVEHVLTREFTARGSDLESAGLYSQALVGMVVLAGHWWLDARSPSRQQVAAQLADLAYGGLSRVPAHRLRTDSPARPR